MQKGWRRVVAWALMAAAVGAAGCSDVEEENVGNATTITTNNTTPTIPDTCVTDDQCEVEGETWFCETQRCVPACQPQADPTGCADGERCDLRPSGLAGHICLEEPAPGDDCAFDEDCPQDLLCEDQICVLGCTVSEDCDLLDETCAPRPSGNAGRVCLVQAEEKCIDAAEPDGFCAALYDDTTWTCDFDNRQCVQPEEGCLAEEDPNQFCQDQLNAQDAFCDSTTSTCVDGSTLRPTVLQIRDESSGEACTSVAMNNQRDPGSDIVFAELRDGTGQTLGYARYLGDAIRIEDNDFVGLPSWFENGSSPSLLGDDCPAEGADGYLSDDTVVTLGCGGALFVQFVDADGAPLPLRTGYQVVVSEYGPRCSQTGATDDGADRYAVGLCTDADAARMGDDAGCTDIQSNLQGFTTVTLP